MTACGRWNMSGAAYAARGAKIVTANNVEMNVRILYFPQYNTLLEIHPIFCYDIPVVITYLGEGSFRIQSGEVSILVDPASNRLKGDVVLKTDAEMPASDAESGPQTEIAFSGEYESKGIEVRGIPLNAKPGRVHTAYLVRWEDVLFLFLGPLGKSLEGELLEKLSEPDVVFLRLGGKYLSDEAAEKIVRQIEPKVVIPAYEKSPASFLKEMGESGGLEEKFVFRKKDLEALQGTKTIALKPA